MADVFISYRKTDVERLRPVDAHLREAGFSVFWDDQITPEKAWDQRLESELREARCVVVLWTPRSIESDWVRTEAHYAHDHGKLVPMMLEPCEPPLAFRMSQTIDLCDWTGEASDKRWRKAITWIGDLVAGAARPAQSGTDHIDAVVRRGTFGALPSGEPIWDGATITASTPAGSAFSDGESLPVFRILPAGEFVMGSPPDELGRRPAEGPQKRIKIPRPFGMSIHPLTRVQALALLGEAALEAPAAETRPRGLFGLFGGKPAARSANVGQRLDDQLPAVGLSLDLARHAARILSERTGERYRIPSEAEWEYACRAGSSRRYACGDEITPQLAAYLCDAQPASGPVVCGRFAPNAFGLFDMHGNVREWTSDLWHDDLTETPADGSPALGGQSAMNVIRGGSYMDGPDMLRSAARARATASVGNAATGVRLVREIR